MNRKVSPAQARDINRLINTEHLKLREVQQFPDYSKLSLTQLHRIAVGKNWGRVTGTVHISSKPSPTKVNH